LAFAGVALADGLWGSGALFVALQAATRSFRLAEVAVPAMLPLLESDRKLAKAFGNTDGVFPDKYYQTILLKAVGDRANYEAGAKVVARVARNPQYRSYWKEKYDRMVRWEPGPSRRRVRARGK
jgi:hypothetical protein